MWPRPQGAKGLGSGHGSSRELFGTAISELRKVDCPIARRILCSCFFAEFGFAVGDEH
jgi:hypothetical protein